MSIFRQIIVLTAALGAGQAAAVTAKRSADAAPLALLEAAPLRGLLGQLALRGEVTFLGKLALGGGYEQFATASERDGYHDAHAAQSAELLFYPLGFQEFPVFLGAGLRRETADIGRQRLRDTNSWARTNTDELYDRWTNRDTYLSTTQSLGYRLLRLGLATASLRLQRDELMSTDARVARDDVKSYDPNLASRGRKTVVSSLLLHAGFYLP